MSSPKVRRVAVIVGATGLLAAAAGCGGAAATSSSSGQSATTQAQAQPPPGARGPDVSALAKALGLSEAKVRAAMQATRPSGAPPSGSAPPAGTASSTGSPS